MLLVREAEVRDSSGRNAPIHSLDANAVVAAQAVLIPWKDLFGDTSEDAGMATLTDRKHVGVLFVREDPRTL
jgi:hypothetical protein